MSVWTYPSGESIVACIPGQKHATLRTWTEEAGRGRGIKRVYDSITSARSADRAQMTSDNGSWLDALELKGRAFRVDPVEVFYPYAAARSLSHTSQERLAFPTATAG